MTSKIDLPDGHHAIFKDRDELSNKEVKTIRRAARRVGAVNNHLKELGIDAVREEMADEATKAAANEKAIEILTALSDEEDDDTDLVQRTCAAVRLIEWSLDLPLPKTAEDIDQLAVPIYKALTEEAAKLDLNDGNFDVDGAADLKAPTEDSNASDAPSEDTP